MITKDKPSDLINQAITNLDPGELSTRLWELMKEVRQQEIIKELKVVKNFFVKDYKIGDYKF